MLQISLRIENYRHRPEAFSAIERAGVAHVVEGNHVVAVLLRVIASHPVAREPVIYLHLAELAGPGDPLIVGLGGAVVLQRFTWLVGKVMYSHRDPAVFGFQDGPPEKDSSQRRKRVGPDHCLRLFVSSHRLGDGEVVRDATGCDVADA